MKWKAPHISKVYEALGAIADHRILRGPAEGGGGLVTAKVYSSSRNKFYDVTYDPSLNALRPGSGQAIMSNDNSAYWKGELGYPAIALLMQLGVLPYDAEVAESLKGIAWKDINQKHKNDFDKTVMEVLTHVTLLSDSVAKSAEVVKFCDNVLSKIEQLELNLLGPKQKPPVGY